MKIPASVRRAYDEQHDINVRLKEVADERIRGLMRNRWHYESRIKEVSSFALKLETGRVPNPRQLEDFFACTIVVGSTTEIGEAEGAINRTFDIKERRPKSSNITHKRSGSFEFDDLRMYAAISAKANEPRGDLAGIPFEIQIKTFLQHAWAIATHDLLYKSDDANWPKERIAYQIKAMLEHAEISIQEAQSLAATNALAKEDWRTAELKEGISVVKAEWETDQLPGDVRRLASNILELLRALEINTEGLKDILLRGKAAHSGVHPSNLSPFGTLVQYLLSGEKEKMLRLLRKSKGRQGVLISDEIELPRGVDRSVLTNAVFVSN